jgi:hypothetical protein
LLLDKATPRTDPSWTAPNGKSLLVHAAASADSLVSRECALMLLSRGADARAVQQTPDGPKSAADFFLDGCKKALARRTYWSGQWTVSHKDFAQLLTALLAAGAPVHGSNAPLALSFLPAMRRRSERAAEELARRRTEREVTLRQEEMAGLAMDWLEMHGDERAVEAKRARLRELEREVGEGTSGESGESEESGESGSASGSDEEDDDPRQRGGAGWGESRGGGQHGDVRT